MMSAEAITHFRGAYSFLSNFYRCEVHFDGGIYPTSEHAFQCQKALLPNDRYRILAAKTPSGAKGIACAVIMVPNWDEIRLDVMKNILRAKFRLWNTPTVRNPLAIRLIQTGDAELIEGNSWGDTFWGQCPIGNGENMLGKLLMKVRHEISHGG